VTTGGRHTAGDGSFQHSAAGAAGRGALLLVVAVVLGIVLLNHFDNGDPYQATAAGKTAVTKAPKTTTTLASSVTTTPLRAPGAIKVLAANGSGTQGAGAKLKDQLTTLGYNALAATNATPTNKVYPTSIVEYAPGLANEAKALAATLNLPDTAVQPLATPPPVADTKGADMVVVVGQDLATRLVSSTTTIKKTTTATTVRTATTVHATTTTKKATTTTKAA
jgi:hypothetical protein